MSEHLLIFDCDGVLVDSELISLGLLIDHCRDHGLSIDIADACRCCLGKPVAVATKEVNRIHNSSVPEIDLDAFQRKVLEQFELRLQPVNGIASALGSLRQAKCVASSSNMDRIRKSLQITGLESYFGDKLFSTDMVSRGKPHPDVFLHAAYKMGYETSKALVIEDSPAGVRAAQAANMKTIAYTGGSHASHADLQATLEALSPNLLIEDMAELPDAVTKLTAG